MSEDNSLLDALGGSIKETVPQEFYESEDYNLASNVDTSDNSHTTSGATTNVQEKALKLLGAGVAAEQVASAIGVSPSYISQLLAEKHFADKVSDLRYAALQKHNTRDGKYDSLEDKLLDKLERAMPLMVRPDTIMKAMQVVNGAKRRGSSGPATVNNTQNIVNLMLPSVITQRFATDINNQVIKAGDQSLLTMPSSQLLKQLTREDTKESSHAISSERSGT